MKGGAVEEDLGGCRHLQSSGEALPARREAHVENYHVIVF